MTWLLSLLSGSWAKILAGIGAAAAGAGAIVAVRQSGKDAARADAARQETKNDATANRVRSDVGGLGNSELDAGLRQYERKP